MADNPDRLAQIMQRMQLSNQRSVGNRLGGANGVTSGATAPTPPSEQIDFTKNTLSPPSMAQPDDTGPGQQMPSVIQPPASSPVGMPSGGNAYSGNQPGVSPSTRDLYSLPDYSGGMGGGNSGGGFDVGRLLKMLSSYMGSQNGQPSAAPPPAPSPSPDMPVNEYQPGYTRTSVPAGIKAPDPFTATTSAMGEMYNTNTGQRYTTTSGGYSAEPGSGWVSQGQPGYVATTSGGTPRQATPDMQISTGEVRYTPEQIAEAEAGFASGRIKKLNIPSLSSLDGRS
jgi:hypothetical protein